MSKNKDDQDFSKYDKYGKSYSKKLKYLKDKTEQETKAKTSQPKVNTIMDAPILNLKEVSTEYKMRFLPSQDDGNWFFSVVDYHWVPHPTMTGTHGKPQTVVVTCAKKYGRECFLCSEYEKIKASTYNLPWEEKKAIWNAQENRAYQPKPKYYSPVLFEGEVMVFGYGVQVRKQLEKCCEDKFGGFFDNPITGFPIYIRKDKTGPHPMNVEYKITYSNGEKEPLAPTTKKIDFILSSVPDVWKFVEEEEEQWKEGTLYTNAQIRSILEGADKDFYRKANREALEEHGFVPEDTGVAEWETTMRETHFLEEATLLEEEDPFSKMDKIELARECKSRGIRTSIKWDEDHYRNALRSDGTDIPF